jgi:molybdopterin-binding protein
MNNLAGTILNIQSSSEMSIIELAVNGDIFSAMVLETPFSASYLKVGNKVEIVFKETEVAIGKGLSGLVSIRNRFKGRIQSIEEHPLLTTIVLDYKGGAIASIISTKSAHRLNLKKTDEVEWLVKTNEVSLCPTI